MQTEAATLLETFDSGERLSTMNISKNALKLSVAFLLAGMHTSYAGAEVEQRNDGVVMEAVFPRYPYAKSGAFAAFVTESFRVTGAREPRTAGRSFFAFMGNVMPSSMDVLKTELARLTDPSVRAGAERTVCEDLHKALKRQIPRFSLDRGFEFSNTVRYGERQCFLQSVVIAALLQRAGITAGVVMVSRNEKGAHCNNGHAVTLARLADGTHLLVDASDPTPFMSHQGLMVAVPAHGGYAYVEPVYDPAHRITTYRSLRDRKKLAPSAVAALDVPFLRSQFEYYRGERAPGGLFNPPLATASGLAESERWLQRSVATCPRNPLAFYMLGRVQERRGKISAAKRAYNDAYLLYAKYGWIPAEGSRLLAAIRLKNIRQGQ
jgi:hypothetical protein